MDGYMHIFCLDHSKLFDLANDNRTRGHSLRLKKERSKTNLRKNVSPKELWHPGTAYQKKWSQRHLLTSLKHRINKFWRDHPSKFEPSFFN